MVAALERAGVRFAFGVASIHNLPLVEVITRSRIRFVPTRTEAGAVNMADAWTRVSQVPAVAITSTGTAAGNAAGSLLEALSAATPILHLTGQVETAHLGAGRGYIHEVPDQLGMLRAVSKVALRALPYDVGEAILRALDVCLSAPRGPASVEIPIDLQQSESATPTRAPAPAEPLPPRPRRVRQAARILARARRPLVWAGGGVLAGNATEALRVVLDRLGAGLITSNHGRGALDEDDPRCVGNFGQSRALETLWRRCDALLSVGTRFRSNETRKYQLPLPPVHVQIDCRPEAIGNSLPASLGVVGDARLALEALAGELEGAAGAEPGWLEEVSAARSRAREELRAWLGPHTEIVDGLAQAARPGDISVRDVTISSSLWGNRLLPIHEPGTNVFAVGGGIGQGLAMAIGAKLAAPARRVVCMVGDGGLVVAVGEMLTARQEAAAVTLVVFDDGGYGVLRNLEEARFQRHFGVDLIGPDFCALAVSMGWRACRVTSAGDFRGALRWALDQQESGEPALVVVDMDAIGPMTRPFVPPE